MTARKEQMMKNKFVAGAIIAALLVPAAAQAQPNYERDRRVTTQQHDRYDHRNQRDIVKHEAQKREAQKQAQIREAQRRNDWRQDQRYRNYRAPFAYQRFGVGSQLRPQYYSSNYRQNWDSRWGLPRAGKHQSYVRHYNDLLLINDRNGKVIRVHRDWFRYR